jgi:Ca-activated chloride channel family protein
MNFIQLDNLPWVITAIIAVVVVYLWLETGFFKWVKHYWFFERSIINKLSSIALILGTALVIIVVLDPREKEIKIKGKVRQEKTILLIDTSTSMLVEDVRPNRLEKAVLVAKHFVRKAVGHHVSVMVFADITKKLVPFTTDIDLLDARIDSVKQLRNMNAGTSIGIAIEEAVRYFDVKDKTVIGNIVVITDGEDNADTEAFKVPDGINLALVAIGTKEGGTVPMRDNSGMYYGVKRSLGVNVISKLNEDFFKSAVKDQKNATYFFAQSYDLPTDQILNFLNSKKAESKEGENVIRPVAMERWAIPGLLLMGLAFGLRFFRPFALSILLISGLGFAEEKKEIPADILKRISQLKAGELDQKEKINLADQLIKIKEHDLAQKLYQENLEGENLKENEESFFNWATSELEVGNIPGALDKYGRLDELAKRGELSSELVDKMRQNIRRALMPPQQDKKKNEKKDKDQDKDKNQEQKNSGSSGEGEGGQSKDQSKEGSEGKGEDNKENKNPFDPKNKDKDKKDQGEEKSDGQKNDEQEKDQQQEPGEPEGGDEKQKRAKASPLLEQLKQDDRKLQLKLLDTSTQKRTGAKKKDW